MAMRELLHTVDLVRQMVPQSSHHEVSHTHCLSLPPSLIAALQMDMAQKVLSSDFQQLIKAMKDAQKNASNFLEGEYQKEMLKAAHIVAKNSKELFDAVASTIHHHHHHR